MEIYDISQELFTSVVFPGDESPTYRRTMKISDGAVCNLTAISMCAHNGTHVDAPYHFYDDGKTIERLSLTDVIGPCYVTTFDGALDASDAKQILDAAKKAESTWPLGKAFSVKHVVASEATVTAPRISHPWERILLRGRSTVTEAAATVFADNGVRLIGNESQTVGPENAPMAVHLILLKKEIVLLEGIRLAHVPDGVYLLNAAPMNLDGSDGAPCRATLCKI